MTDFREYIREFNTCPDCGTQNRYDEWVPYGFPYILHKVYCMKCEVAKRLAVPRETKLTVVWPQ